jgi:lichenan operon transcriptional antiterminator
MELNMKHEQDRYLRIAHYLLNSKQSLTSLELARIFNVSSRTIKTDIKILIQNQETLGLNVHSQNAKGYAVELVELKYWEQAYLQTDSHDYNNQADRVLTLLRVLVNSQDYISLNVLEKDLFVSRSTLIKDLDLVKKLLNEENTQLELKKNYGIKIVGDELSIRKIMLKYIDIDLNSIDSYNKIYASNVFTFDDIKFLTKAILGIFDSYKVPLLGLDVTNILIHIMISSYRVKHGFQILNIDNNIDQNRNEYKIASDIVKVIHDKFHIHLSQFELMYLALTLISKGVPNTNNYEEIKTLIQSTYQKIGQSYDIDFDIEDDYSNALIYHVQAMKDRLIIGANIEAKVIEMVREKFVLAYEMALLYQQEFQLKYQISLNNVELCYLALHFGAMLENLEIKKTLPKLYIISELRSGNVLLLKNECIANLGHLVHVEGVLSPYEIQNLKINASDILLTTEKNSLLNQYRTLKVPTIFSTETFDEIREFIYKNKSSQDLFQNSLFFIETETVENIEQYLRYKTQYFQQLSLINDADLFYKETLEREKIQSTRYASLLALPHPINAMAEKSFISTIIFKQGAKWFDQSSVQLIFYIGIKPKEKNIADSFQLLSKITSNPSIIQEILQVASFAQFKSILNKIKKQEEIL